MTSTAPIVVIGGGTAGCTVVSHLASHTQRDIVLVEPGAVVSTDDEPRFYDALSHDDVTRTREVHIAQSHTGVYREGRAVGGGSAINGMLLTGDEPEHLRGLTRMATHEDCGLMGETLLRCGGEFTRLWWNRGRWNPGRAVQHLVDEGRVRIVTEAAQQIQYRDGRAISVVTTGSDLQCSHLVLTAGAIATPELLLQSGCGDVNAFIGVGLANHPSITVPFTLAHASTARFDASVIYRHGVSSSGEIQMFAFERASDVDAQLGLISVALMNPDSVGHVQLVDGVCTVDFNALHSERDQECLTSGVEELLRAISHAEAMPGVHLATPADDLFSLQEFESARRTERVSMVRDHVEVLSHATSSCMKAVGSNGNLLGFDGVTIADASVLSLPNCTPAAPVTMEALRIARILGEELS